MLNIKTKESFLFFVAVLLLLVSSGLVFKYGFITPVSAAPNYEINYQGKLTDDLGVTVANGVYDMRFRLYDAPTGGSVVWTEFASTTVTNGLFSVMLGSSTPLTGVDFNQTLYLGVRIEADAEMEPRKILGAVPAAFEAGNAETFANLATTSFLRSDQADTALGLLTFTNGFISQASSTIFGLTTNTATTTAFVINGQRFTNLLGSGLTNVAGALTANISESNLNIAAAPVNGYVLQASSTAAGGFAWVATSSLNIASGVDVAFGTDNQIPYTSAGGDDFDYSSNFTFDGSLLTVNGSGYFSANLTVADDLSVLGNTVFGGEAYYPSSSNLGSDPFGGQLASVDYVNSRDFTNVSSGLLTHIDFDDQGDHARGVWGDGKFVYVANNDGGLLTYSVSATGSVTHIDTDDQGDAALGVWGDGKFIYVANFTGGILTYSVSDTGVLTFIDADDQGDQSHVVWGDGKFIYLANSTGGILSYSVSESGVLTFIDADDQGDSARSVWGDGEFIYLANGGGGLLTYSVSDTGILTHIDTDDQGDFATVVWGDGEYIYLANDTGGLHTYAVSESGILTHIDTDDQGDSANGVWGDGKFIYLANNGGGLHTYRVDNAYEYDKALAQHYFTGNVGIGTTTPSELFSIAGSAPQAYFYDSINNRGAYFGVGDGFNAVVDSLIGYTIIKSNGVTYFTAGGNVSYFQAGRNVGIGTSTPSYTLDVYGNVRIDGNLVDSIGSAGTAGWVLQSTATGIEWVATSSLNIASGAVAFLDLADVTIGTFSANRIPFTNGDGNAIIDSADFAFNDTTDTLTIGGLTLSDGLVTFSSRSTTTIPHNMLNAFTIATSTTARPLFSINTTAGAEEVIIGGSGSGDVVIGSVGQQTNLVFEEDATIHGQGGNTITFGQTGDIFNFAVNLGVGTSTPLGKLTVYGNTLLEGANRYLNFGTAVGTTSYGIRDNAGTLQFKHSSGVWADIGSGGASIWTESGSDIYFNTGQVMIGTTSPRGADDLLTVHSVSENGAKVVISSGYVGNSGPNLSFFHSRNGAPLSNWDSAGSLEFRGMNSASADSMFANITTLARNTTNGSEEGAFYLDVTGNGVYNYNQTYIDGSEFTINKANNNVDFRIQDDAGLLSFIADASTGYIGIGTSTPGARLDVYGLAGLGDIFRLSSSTLERVLTVAATGYMGLGTSDPQRRLDIMEPNAVAQFRITKTLSDFAEFLVNGVGDLYLSATGGDIFAADENLYVCEGDACPTSTATSTKGNLFVENAVTIGDGFSLRQIAEGELGLYNTDGTLMVTFDSVE